ncbi:unnamed protein product [Penicillium pancosmium]
MSIPGRRLTTSIGARRKTTEACDPCRTRKLKCDGLLPCQSCEKSKVECLYDPSTGTNKITGGLDIINARVVELERAVFGERTLQPRNTASISDSGQILDQNLPGVTMYSQDNGSLSFYGTTSTLNLFIPVERLLNDPQCDSERPNKKQKRSDRESEATSAVLNGALQDQIYATNSIHKIGGLIIRERISDAHIDCFLGAVSDTIPVLAPSTVRAAYQKFWSSSPSELETSLSRQRQCLIYSVLALGSLYSSKGPEGSEWASYYFTEAQGLIGTFFNTNSLETVQAAMMMDVFSDMSRFNFIVANAKFSRIVRKILDLVGS